MGDGNAVSAQLLAEKHILVAIVAETLVEGVGEHQVTTDEEIGCMEVAIGILLAYLNRMLMLNSLLIAITEIVFEDIWIASIVAMEAGADFIKTSTGKLEPAATPEAICVMCEAIKAYTTKTGRKVGIKPAGGMTVSEDALLYMAAVENILGTEWLNNKLFRLGASRMANNILTDIVSIETGKVQVVKYF